MHWLQNILKRKYIVLDANVILRYLLNDVQEQYDIVDEVISKYSCIAYLEVIEEVVYVLQKVYNVNRDDVKDCITRLMQDITIDKSDILSVALDEYCKSPKIDFVDCILCGYAKTGRKVFSFDKKLNKRL